MTLTQFLEARISADEALARAELASYPWNTIGPDTDDIDPANLRAIHSPHRWVAECEAKRAIIGLYENEPMWEPGHDEAVYQAMMALASVYAGHPDFEEAWKP